MNYFIMLAKAVIKCAPFYDNGVIEGGCNKNCLGLFFHPANAEMDKKEVACWKYSGFLLTTPPAHRLSDLKTEQASHAALVNCAPRPGTRWNNPPPEVINLAEIGLICSQIKYSSANTAASDGRERCGQTCNIIWGMHYTCYVSEKSRHRGALCI